ncbi:hypothetical protein E6C67_08125 [Azospirillum sp. TSA2s]|uniref:hypothetical protein n=1 Tax=Azospirillum sp. TSA2s TaxID=709810 RepID=UPI0010AA09EE|nr:hypothetical protein [Azospirillum sp. TSA2s]QCG93907.1 hypothetical protein E6C67_08125 [Azospirillum sp. TSA2s]
MTDTNANLRFWSDLSRTDPKFTKPFKRAGGFTGTDINPTWRIMRMTERFGPCGTGWGTTKPEYTAHQIGEATAVYCTLGLWYVENGAKSEPVYGVGGDIVSKKRDDGKIAVDDEAYKKAFTDALGNAMKAIGVSADVFLKQFDDSKYRETVAAEFEEKRREAAGPTDGEKAAAGTIKLGIDQCQTTEELTAFWREHVKHINSLPEALKQDLINHAGDRKRALTPSVAAE